MKKSKNILISLIILATLSGCESITPLKGGVSSKNAIGSMMLTSSDSNERAQKIYYKCAGCHGKNGEKSALGKSQPIGGEHKDILLYELQEYKAGRLDQYGMGQLMKGQVAGLSDSELELVADYISKLPGI